MAIGRKILSRDDRAIEIIADDAGRRWHPEPAFHQRVLQITITERLSHE
jgi:hypothetical protein